MSDYLTEHEAWQAIGDILEHHGMPEYFSAMPEGSGLGPLERCAGLCVVILRLWLENHVSRATYRLMRARIQYQLHIEDRIDFGPFQEVGDRLRAVRLFESQTGAQS